LNFFYERGVLGDFLMNMRREKESLILPRIYLGLFGKNTFSQSKSDMIKQPYHEEMKRFLKKLSS